MYEIESPEYVFRAPVVPPPFPEFEEQKKPDQHYREDPERTRTYTAKYRHLTAGCTYGKATKIYSKHEEAPAEKPWDPWYPLINSYDYSLVRWMLGGSVSKDRMQAFLDNGLDRFESPDIANADSLRSRMENLAWGLGEQNSWLRYNFQPEDIPSFTKRGPYKHNKASGTKGFAEEEARNNPATVYYRDIMKCIQLLIGHLPFQDNSDYEPVKMYDDSGARVYNEINSGKWWWKTQQKISVGGTLVPVLLASDKTHLTNYSGDKSGWPLYMSIGNIHKDIRRKLSNNAWILLGLLPVPPKACGRSFADNVFHTAVDKILAPLKNINPNGEGVELHCADGHIRRGFPILAAWIADYPEYSTIMGCTSMWCPCCEIPLKEMGHVQVKTCGG